MKDYKVFSEDELSERVKFFWNLMIKSEFPDQEIYSIQFKNVDDFSSWCWDIKKKLAFGKGLLTGKYALWFVDTIIRHEIGHALDYMRNGFKNRKKDSNNRRGWMWDGHGKHFKKIAKEFDFHPNSLHRIINLHRDGVTALNPDFSEDLSIYRYFLTCKCGYERKQIRRKGIISSMYRYNSTKYHMSCPECKKDSEFTLYHFKNGIEAGTEVDYEAYYNMFGGEKIT